MKSVVRFLACIVAMLSINASANEAALYAPQVQSDEALVRVLNLSESKVDLMISPLNKNIRATNSFKFSDYVRAKEGMLNLKVEQKQIELAAKAGESYTLVIKPDLTLKVVLDNATPNKGKSMLALYNFSDSKTLSLKTINGKTSIIDGVKPDNAGFRQINAMELNMGIFNDKAKLRETHKQQFLKDSVHNIAVIDSDSGIAIAIMLSNTNTRI